MRSKAQIENSLLLASRTRSGLCHLLGGGPGGLPRALQGDGAQGVALVHQHERVGVLRLELSEGVVHISVVALIRKLHQQ